MKPKALKRLIDMTQDKLDEAHLEKVSIEHTIESLERKLQELKDELIKEQEFIAKNPELAHSYENFYKSSTERQSAVSEEIAKAQEKLAKIQELILELYQEQKKYEHILDNHYKALAEKERKEENKMFDESNSIRYQRAMNSSK